jgi:hypothetical protein
MNPEYMHACLTVLYVAGALHDLEDRHYLEGPDVINMKGVATYDQLKTDGFRPHGDMLRACLSEVFQMDDEMVEEAARLIENLDEILDTDDGE